MIKGFLKKIFLLKDNDPLSSYLIYMRWNYRPGRFFYRKKYATEDLVMKLKEIGINEGDNVFLHSSWDSFYNYKGSVKDLVSCLLELIGDKGTLAMPAFPYTKGMKDAPVFNVKRTMSGAGMITETFRRFNGVLRSCNVRHSVCAKGPLADYLVKDHQKSLTCFDEMSPYYRICEKDFKILSLGIPPYQIGTITHVVHSLLRTKLKYFANFYDEDSLEEQKFIDYEGKENTYYAMSEPTITRWSYIKCKLMIKRFFDHKEYRIDKISNLNIAVFNANYSLNRLIELAYKRIVIYYQPRFKKSDLQAVNTNK